MVAGQGADGASGKREPARLRQAALQRLCAAGGFDATAFFTMRVIDGRKHVTGLCCADRIARPVDVFGVWAQAGTALDLRHPPQRQRDGFADHDATEPFGHVQHLLVYNARRFVGLVGGFRARPGAAADRVRLQLEVPRLRTDLIAADGLEQQALPLRGALIARPDGGVSHANTQARAWLERPGVAESLRELVRRAQEAPHEEVDCLALVDLAEAHLVPVRGASGACYLVQLRPTAAPLLAADAVLSPTRRRIARYAAAGATVAEIAQVVHRSRESVKSHLRAIYEALGVSTRLELAEALADEPEPP